MKAVLTNRPVPGPTPVCVDLATPAIAGRIIGCRGPSVRPWQVLLAVLLLSAGTERASAARCQGAALPARIAAGDSELLLRGTGLREATWLGVDVYLATLYLPAGTRDAAAALAPETAKQMRLQLLRDVSREDMAGNIAAGFRKAAGSRFARHSAALDQLLAMIPPLAEGDSFVLDYRPGSGDPGSALQLWHGSRALGRLPGGDFARTLFAIWLGEEPLNQGLKLALLGGPCNG